VIYIFIYNSFKKNENQLRVKFYNLRHVCVIKLLYAGTNIPEQYGTEVLKTIVVATSITIDI
jgi:hypothetical protein